MENKEIWETYNEQLYFFILKRVNDKDASNDIFQNAFLKIILHHQTLKDQEKIKAWVFQITRNEIANYFLQKSKHKISVASQQQYVSPSEYLDICCFDRFIKNLPNTYREAIELVYLEGKKQSEAAEILNISMANVKARIRRGKALLKKNFNECCRFEFNEDGNLTGDPDCAYCA